MVSDSLDRDAHGGGQVPWLGAPSREHWIPATPDGPAVAVAVRCWMPADTGASCGPEIVIVGAELST